MGSHELGIIVLVPVADPADATEEVSGWGQAWEPGSPGFESRLCSSQTCGIMYRRFCFLINAMGFLHTAGLPWMHTGDCADEVGASQEEHRWCLNDVQRMIPSEDIGLINQTPPTPHRLPRSMRRLASALGTELVREGRDLSIPSPQEFPPSQPCPSSSYTGRHDWETEEPVPSREGGHTCLMVASGTHLSEYSHRGMFVDGFQELCPLHCHSECHSLISPIPRPKSWL